MIKWFSLGFWELIVVLRNRILMLSIIVVTALLALQWKNIHFYRNQFITDDTL
jgi:hypothetical protein